MFQDGKMLKLKIATRTRDMCNKQIGYFCEVLIRHKRISIELLCLLHISNGMQLSAL